MTVHGQNFGSVRSRGYAAETYGNVEVFVSEGARDNSSIWQECREMRFVRDDELVCLMPAGAGRRNVKVVVREQIEREGFLGGGFIGTKFWAGVDEEDTHCSAYGRAWLHRQDLRMLCGTKGALALWHGGGLETIGVNMTTGIRAVAVLGPAASGLQEVLLAGSMRVVNGTRVNGLLSFDGLHITPRGLGLDGTVSRMDVYGTSRRKVVVTGDFTRAFGADGASVNTGGVAVWDDDTLEWETLGGEVVHGVALGLAVRGEHVFVGGRISSVGQRAVANVAHFDGQMWHALGEGVVGEILAMETTTTDLYVGGRLSAAGRQPVDNVAQWDGKNWLALLDRECLRSKSAVCGVQGEVLALAVVGQYLYAGGSFSTAGGRAAANIARFFSGRWEALSGGVDGNVRLIATVRIPLLHEGFCIYVAGDFDLVTDARGAHLARGLARWCVNSATGGSSLVAFWEPLALPSGVLAVRAIASQH